MNKNITILKLLTFLFFTFYSFNTYAQCAGDDNVIEICIKETYNQGLGNPDGVLDLFALLGGSPVAGGTWTDLNSSGGLNISTGLLNTWGINQSGVFNYEYTVTGVSGCTDNTAIITLTLGGYPGSDNPFAVACDNNPSVPLFSFLGSFPNPHFNGTWSGGPPGAVTGNFFNAQLAGQGTYILTYTVPAIGTCPSRMATVTLTVHPLPNAGTPIPLIFCETDDLSAFTNVDLFDQLTGEDGGGSWSENSGTSELSGPGDSLIDIQNIANTFGPGTYTFTYSVNPSHPICTPSTANVAITIEPVVDLNGATLSIAPNICINEIGVTQIIGTITQGATTIPDGTYDITYVLTGANSGTETVTVTFSGGTATFTVNDAFLSNSGVTTVEITTVIDTNTTLNCTRTINNLTSTFEIYNNPDLSDSNLNIEDICINETAVGEISDINAGTIELEDGSYTITFDITGPSGSVTGQTAVLTVSGGNGTFSIPGGLTNLEGNYTLTITNIVNNATGCSSTANLSDSFEVFPIPDAETISVSINDVCDGENVVVNITGATSLVDGLYDITYDVTGAISVTGQTETNVSFSGGNATFTLPNGILQIGISTLTITNLFSTATTCETTTFTNPSATFEIHAIPDASDINITVDDICLNQSALVNIFDINPGTAPELTDGDYTITYDLSGANNASGETVTVTITGGNGSFTIPASLLTNTGITDIILVIITNNTTGCDAIGVPISTSFEVLENPIIDNASITVTQPICQNSGTSVTISGTSIADGDYTLTYDITGANTLIGQTIAVVFTGGSATFTIPPADIPNLGNYTITITNIVDDNNPNACSSPVSNVSTTFVVSENPDLTNTTISALDPICLGSDGVITLNDSGTLLDGTYDLVYDVSGSNSATNQAATVTITSGTGTFNIPASLLTNTGNTTITITSVANATTGCISPASLVVSFDIIPVPDTTSATLTVVEPICVGSDATVNINGPFLTDGSYDILYNLTGVNTATDIPDTIVITANNGSFTIPASFLTNTGTTSVVLTFVQNLTTGCSVSGLTISDDFTINIIPTLDNSNISVADICLGSDATLSFSTSLPDGDYTINYDISGANGPSSQSDVVTLIGGNGNITISSALLANTGATTISVTSITNVSSTCGSSLTDATTTFNIVEYPDVTGLTLDVANGCQTSDAGIGILNATNLPDGNYVFTFDLSGANTATGETATVFISGGVGVLIVDGSLLPNLGTTTITITNIENETGCSATGLSISDSFDVLALPNVTNLTLSANDICLADDLVVTISNATSLTDGDYEITFDLTGDNTGTDTVTSTITSGSGTFVVPSTLLVNSGATTISVSDFVLSTSQCGANTTSINPITINITSPDAPTLIAGGNAFCIQDNPTFSDLSTGINESGNVIWYDSETGGTAFSDTDILTNGTTYYASITDTNGCESITRLQVTVDLTACSELFIPDGFSPNGDGLNEEFYIKNIDVLYPEFELEIYNRYGNMVYKGDINTPRFNGKANQTTLLGNNILPTGVYFYIVYFNDNTGKEPIQGRLYLSR